MHTQLVKIFDMRNALLKRCNLKFYNTNEAIIKNSSLAAQDFYYSGDLADYDNITPAELSHDSLYASLHAVYNIPYNTTDVRRVNCGLVLDLARALRHDIQTGIINNEGEVIAPEKISKSMVLQTYHNSEDSGVPMSYLGRMTPNTRIHFIRLYCKQKKR